MPSFSADTLKDFGAKLLITADSGRSSKIVAPYGGREARLGTNPISIAVPSNLESPLYLDMALPAFPTAR